MKIFLLLHQKLSNKLLDILNKFNFTFSQINILQNIDKDFRMWNDNSIDKEIPELYFEKYKDKQLSKKIFEHYVSIHNTLKNRLNDYKDFDKNKYETRKYSFNKIEKNQPTLGFNIVSILRGIFITLISKVFIVSKFPLFL